MRGVKPRSENGTLIGKSAAGTGVENSLRPSEMTLHAEIYGVQIKKDNLNYYRASIISLSSP